MKTCNKCKIEKSKDKFYSAKSTVDKLCKICKECISIKNKLNRDNRSKEEEFKIKVKKQEHYKLNSDKYKTKATNRLLLKDNRINHNKSQLKWAHSNFNKRKNASLKHNYGITLEDYNLMFKKQNGKCFICNTLKNVLHVDHCHTTNKVRGLLCGNCNKALGLLKDNIDILQTAINYLNLHEKKEDQTP